MANDKTSALKEEIWNEYLPKYHTTKQLIDLAIRKTQEADKTEIDTLKEIQENLIKVGQGITKEKDELQSEIKELEAQVKILSEQIKYGLEVCKEMIDKLDENLKTSPNNNFKVHSDLPKFSPDNIFIKHIQSHNEVQNAPTHQGKAMCKVCGKLAEDIIKEAKTS